MVGINTAIYSRSGGSIGIGFAIPVNLAKPVVTQLADSGHVTRGWLGVAIQPLTTDLAKGFGRADATGALVASVPPGSPAMAAGITAGDIVTEFDGRRIGSAADLPRMVAETPVGREVVVAVLRDGKPVTLRVRVGRLAEAESDGAGGTRPAGRELGLEVQPLTEPLAQSLGVSGATGVVVSRVEPGSRAEGVGLERGDVIEEVDRQPVHGVKDLQRLVAAHPSRSPLILRVRRGAGDRYVTVTG